MLITVAGATLMAAGLVISAGPAFATPAPGAVAINAQADTNSAVQPVYYRRGGDAARRPYARGGWGYRRSGEWATRYSYGAYNPGYYSGYRGNYGGGYPAGYWGGYSGWGPGVSIGVSPGFGIGFGF